jgi:hypothetical protein
LLPRKAFAGMVAWGICAAMAAAPLPAPRFRYQVICRVDDSGTARCVRIDQWKRLLDPADVQRLQNILADLFPQLAGRRTTARNTLVDCGHDVWNRAAVPVPASSRRASFGAAPGSPRKTPPFPSSNDADLMVSACRSSVQSDFDRAVQGAGGGRSQFVSDTVSRMDAAVAGCRDQTSPVAEAGGVSQYVDARARFDAAAEAVADKYSGDQVRSGDPAAQAAYAALTDAKDTRKFLEDVYLHVFRSTDLADRNDTLKFIAGILNELAESLEKLAQTAPTTTPAPETTPAPAPAPETTPAPAPQTTAAPAPSTSPGPAPEPAPGLGPKPPGPNPTPPSGVAMPCMAGDCKPTCEQIAAGWSMFKTMCEQSQWQAYPCVAFLAAANGCVDPRLIHPTPDGDMPCPSNARLDKWSKFKQAWVDQCRKRSWVMMPVDQGKFLCVAPDFGVTLPGFDPCHDPRAMPGPDDCTGPVPPPDPSAPKPPRPDPHRG